MLPSLFTEELCELTIYRRGKKGFSCLLTMPIQEFHATLSTAKPQTASGYVQPSKIAHLRINTVNIQQLAIRRDDSNSSFFLRNFDGLTRLAPEHAHFEA